MFFAADSFYNREYKTCEEVVDYWNQKVKEDIKHLKEEESK